MYVGNINSFKYIFKVLSCMITTHKFSLHNEYSENFSFVPFVVFILSRPKPFFTSKKEKRKQFFCAHYFKSKTVVFGRE